MAEAQTRFGTSGWRAIIADEFTFPNARRVIAAIAKILDEEGRSGGLVLVGYDTRFLADRFAAEAAGVLSRRGFRAEVSSRPVPTPVLAFEIRRRGAVGAVNFTASHNPPQVSRHQVLDVRRRSRAAEDHEENRGRDSWNSLGAPAARRPEGGLRPGRSVPRGPGRQGRREGGRPRCAALLARAKLAAYRKAPPSSVPGRRVAKVNQLDGIKLIFEDGSWILIRESGTEPVARVYIEAKTESDLDALARAGRELIA